MSVPDQYNLWTVEQMKQFYADNKEALDTALREIVLTEKPQYSDNYTGMLENGKPHTLTKYKQFLNIAFKVYSVLSYFKNKPEIINLRNTHTALEAVIYGFIYIESKCDHRANLVSPRGSSSIKGLVQISSRYAGTYPDFSGKIANFNPISTKTENNKEPANSIYNAWKSIERVLVFLHKNDKAIKDAGANTSNKNRKYPVAGWPLYLYWNQGFSAGKTLLNIYLKNPNTLISTLSPGLRSNLNNNTFNKGPSKTVGEWFEKMRLEYNIGYYLLCNSCIARYFKKRIEKNSNQRVSGPEILNSNITCPPLEKSEYKIPLGSFKSP